MNSLLIASLSAASVLAVSASLFDQFSQAKESLEKLDAEIKAQPTQDEILNLFYYEQN